MLLNPENTKFQYAAYSIAAFRGGLLSSAEPFLFLSICCLWYLNLDNDIYLLVIAKARSAPWMMVVSIEHSEKF